MDLSLVSWIYFLISALIVGFSKTSVGGLGIIVVLTMALAFPAKESVGVLLPMLVAADIIAVIFYKRDCNWKIIFKIFPLTALGVVLGYFILDKISKDIFEVVLGVIILSMLVLSTIIEKKNLDFSDSKLFAIPIGILAGIATMLANAAGPLMAIYFLQLGLPKKDFVGTRSWFFLLLNVFKLPFSANLGLISFHTLSLNLLSIPIIVLGAFLGVKFLKKIDMNIFSWLIKISAFFVSIKLIFF
jgi:uncharacterized protein